MSKHDNPIVPLDSEYLGQRLAELGSELGRGRLDEREIEHLISVVLRCSAWLEDVYSSDRLQAILSHDPGRLLLLFPPAPDRGEDEDPERRLVRRWRQLPDAMRRVGDKALFDLSLCGRTSVHGLELGKLGPRAYLVAAEVLHRLAEESRSGRPEEERPAADAGRIDDEAEFLRRCSARFNLYARMLRALGHDEGQDSRALIPVPAEYPEGLPLPPLLGAGLDDPLLAQAAEELGQAETETERVRLLASLERLLLFADLDLERLRADLDSIVVDQPGAIATLCDDLALMAVGTQRVNKPLGYFLVGPTGVGKNYVVETLAIVLQRQWGTEIPLLTIEGPNYTYPSDINELRGATRGFIRSDEPGLLSEFHERAASAPLAMILVDEVEKAHPQLRRFFLSILDRGTTTDAHGAELAFDGVLIFFTSNIGYRDRSPLNQPIGFGGEEDARAAYGAELAQSLRRTLSPEFINRVKLVRFEHLPRGSAERIAQLEFDRIAEAYARRHRLSLELTESARALIVDQGYSREYGARRLAAVIQQRCNVEVGKLIRRDEERDRGSNRDLLQRVRSAKEQGSAVPLQELGAEVLEQARARLAYRRIVIDAEGGELVYRRD